MAGRSGLPRGDGHAPGQQGGQGEYGEGEGAQTHGSTVAREYGPDLLTRPYVTGSGGRICPGRKAPKGPGELWWRGIVQG